MEAASGLEPENTVLQTVALITWLCRPIGPDSVESGPLLDVILRDAESGPRKASAVTFDIKK